MVRNMRSSIARGLPPVAVCKPHKHVLSIAGGGPSLADTFGDLHGYVATINGSLRYLLTRPVIAGLPYFCGVCDPGEHIADLIEADRDVRYYVASVCHPSVFEKLKKCEVVLWHITPNSTGAAPDALKALNTMQSGWLAIGGGCTMGLRWLNLGYTLGFRHFEMHGFDSSFRDGATHAYPDRADAKEHLQVEGRSTRANFLAQISDFFRNLHTFSQPAFDPIVINVHGDGLLQDLFRQWRAENPGKFTS